tara:strand:+ start:1198 stop:1863 length:666 start_codon:yes stop_codon:yes gene_type:complete
MNILLIDDDPSYCNQFQSRMSPFCEVQPLNEISEPIESLTRELVMSADAILIDLKMPGIDGITLYKRFREIENNIPPVLILTEYESKDFRLMAYREGIDDFINKDATAEEIFLRIKKALDHSRSHLSNFSGLILNHGDMSCQLDGKSVELTRIEFQILKTLLCAPDHRVSKPDLVNRIWKHKKVSAHTLNTHVYNLNSKLKTWDRVISIGTTGIVHISPKQ